MPLFHAIRYLGLALLAAVVTIESSFAQGPTVVTGGGFVPGGQVLYASNFAQDPIGNFPSGLKYVRGPLEVVQVNGIPMLRSTGPAEFIIPLSAPLPQDFTLEFDLVARNSNCCSGEELAFEGSPQLNRSVGSAWVAWHHQYSGIIGGGQDLGTSTVRFPEDLQNELLGQLGQIQVQVSGTRFRLFTNGRQIYNIPDLVFRRTTVLRIFLGGVDDATGAVYLARVRLATGAPAAGVVATNPPSPPAGVPAPPSGTGAPAAPPGTTSYVPPVPPGGTTPATPRPLVPAPPTGTAPSGPRPLVPAPPTGTAPSGTGPVVPAPPPSSASGGTGPVVPAPPPPPPVVTSMSVVPPPASATPMAPPPPTPSVQPKAGVPLGAPNTTALCTPAQTLPGRGPTSVSLGGDTPVGAELVWDEVPGAIAYLVERGPAGSGTRSPVGSTCDTPPTVFIVALSGGGTRVEFRDATGGIQQRATYTYVVHALAANGATGWNSIRWTAPSLPPISAGSTVTGSTVHLKWNQNSQDPITRKPVASPKDFLIASSYGLSMVKSRGSFTGCSCYVDILGVPIGTHTFTITARYPPDVTVVGSTQVTVVP